MLIWISFWLTYLIISTILYDSSFSKSKMVISFCDIIKIIITNMFITLLLSLFITLPMIKLSPTLSNYIIHIIIAFIIGDLCSYGFHRLLHTSYFYHIHKIHHRYIIPHTFVGVYCHPIEMMFNYLSILLSLMMTSSYNNLTLMMEASIISLGILLSHRANVNLLFDFGSKMHNIHHQQMNYNYGFSMIIDWLFGTLKLT